MCNGGKGRSTRNDETPLLDRGSVTVELRRIELLTSSMPSIGKPFTGVRARSSSGSRQQTDGFEHQRCAMNVPSSCDAGAIAGHSRAIGSLDFAGATRLDPEVGSVVTEHHTWADIARHLCRVRCDCERVLSSASISRIDRLQEPSPLVSPYSSDLPIYYGHDVTLVWEQTIIRCSRSGRSRSLVVRGARVGCRERRSRRVRDSRIS